MKSEEKEIDLINIQEILSVTGIIVLIISIFIAENAKRRIKNENPFWTEEEERNMSILARVILVITALISIYLAWQGLVINEEKGSDQKTKEASEISLMASVLGLIVAGLILWAGISSQNDILGDVELPIE